MKRPWWIVTITLAVACGAASAPVLADTGQDDLVTLLAQEVENREANLKHAKTQFEAGTVGRDAVLQAERDLLQARQELVRADRPQPVNPLTRPIPHLQITDADLGEVGRLLKEVLEEKVNFILQGRAEELPIPDLDLRQTDLLTLLNILSEIVPDLEVRVTAGSRILPLADLIVLTEASRASALRGGGGMMGLPGGMMMGGGTAGGPGMLFDAGMGGTPTPGIEWSEQPTIIFEQVLLNDPEPRETMTLYLGGLLATIDLDDVLTSIETAWELNPALSEPTLRFHEDTELLIAAGEKQQLQMILEVVEQLGEMQEDLRERSKRSLKEEYEIRHENLMERVEEEREAMAEKVEGARAEARARIGELEEVNAELEEAVAMMEGEFKSSRERFETERHNLLKEMEAEIRNEREKAFHDRRELLETIDGLERELRRKLEETVIPAEGGV